VVVVAAGEELVGRAVDIEATGGLVLETATGRRLVDSGEVTRVRREVPA
jgi:hypothetical protein